MVQHHRKFLNNAPKAVRVAPILEASGSDPPSMGWARRRVMAHRRFSLLVMGLACALLAPAMAARDSEADRYWPQWRGPYANGVSRTAKPPLEWSETKNIKWKVEIPGRGASTPVIWGDRAYVLTAVPVGLSGDAAHAAGAASSRGTSTALSTSPSIDATVASCGSGSHAKRSRTRARTRSMARGRRAPRLPTVSGSSRSSSRAACTSYDMNGSLLWHKHFGKKLVLSETGEGTTPVIYGNYVVLVWDHQGESFIVVLDKDTGKEIWRKLNAPNWTPGRRRSIVEHEGRAQVIVNGWSVSGLRPRDREGDLAHERPDAA